MRILGDILVTVLWLNRDISQPRRTVSKLIKVHLEVSRSSASLSATGQKDGPSRLKVKRNWNFQADP